MTLIAAVAEYNRSSRLRSLSSFAMNAARGDVNTEPRGAGGDLVKHQTNFSKMFAGWRKFR
jgi:hypothetical protein